MNDNGGRDIGFKELNNHRKEEHDRDDNGVVGDSHRPGSFRNGDLRIDKVDGDVKDGRGKLVQGQFVVQVPQLQPQGSRVHWERFLNVRSIKVMLVENDDSTRHIVTALLRNCNYEVIEAANGLQAWKVLEDLTVHVDIILTEVAMPLLSGVSLLCKIMNHNTRKNIPVIMMSSHDSMGLVFKCLSKGAVDFLVKPIRKNELKILWQHVWRRCHSSSGSGSGSESGTQNQKSVKSKSSVRSEKNSDSNDGDDDESNGLDTGDGSDDGSGNQSFWTKQAVEVDSPRGESQWFQKPECQDSTCGQVIRSNIEAPGTRDIHGHEQLVNLSKGKELVIGKSNHCEGGECSSHKQKAVHSNILDPQKDYVKFEALRESASMEIKNNLPDDPNEGAVTELSLKRLREVKDTERTVQYDRNVLRHSELSAFSRYNNMTAKASSDPSGITRRSSLLNNKSDVTKKESMQDVRSHSDGYVNRISNRNNMDVESATDKLHMNPLILKDKSEVTFTINTLHSPSAFKPIKTEIKSFSQQGPTKTNEMKIMSKVILDPPRYPHHELPVQHIHHHHHVHHYHEIDGGDQSLSNPDDLSLKKLASDAQYCGSSNVMGGPVLEGIPGNCSLNRSASGSKYGSNGQNGSSTVVNTGGANMESIVGVAPRNGNGDDSGSGSGNGIDQSKSAQREAALTKFRQKRKERCFQKKVRYQNRKKLAEQRPRVRGQFVKQTGNTDNSSSGADG